MSGLSLAPQVLGDERAPEVSRRVGSSGFPRGQGAAGRCSARRTAWAPSCWCLSLEGGRSPRCGPLFPRDELMSAAPYVMSLQEKVQLLSETCWVFFK